MSLVPISSPVAPTHNYTGHAFEGGKYQQTCHLGIVDIAKLVRKELKTKFPGFRFSVRCEKYAGGCSLNVSVTKWPDGFDWVNPFYKVGPDPFSTSDVGSEERRRYYSRENEDATELLKTIEKVCNQYNYEDCDGMIDYFNVTFYLRVGNSVRHPIQA